MFFFLCSKIKKEEFIKDRNDRLDYERYVHCFLLNLKRVPQIEKKNVLK